MLSATDAHASIKIAVVGSGTAAVLSVSEGTATAPGTSVRPKTSSLASKKAGGESGEGRRSSVQVGM
jgi:hypothetical protein